MSLHFLVAMTLLGGVLDDCEKTNQRGTIVRELVAYNDADMLVRALAITDLTSTLNKAHQRFTLFAPLDGAFKSQRSLFERGREKQLRDLLLYHVVPGDLAEIRHDSTTKLGTANGKEIRITRDATGLLVNNLRVVSSVPASNGRIYFIQELLDPQAADAKSIVGVAAAAGTFGNLLAAVEAAGLKPALVGPGPLTVLAPTDEAFAKLGKKVNELLKPENRKLLTKILKYHVVSGEVNARAAVTASSAETLSGQRIRFEIRAGQLFVNDSRVIATDIKASNGIIHAIDTVLMPPN